MLIRPMVATYLPKLFIAKELVDPQKNAGQQLRCLSHSWHPAALKIPGASERGIGMAFLHAPVRWSERYKLGEELVSRPASSKACYLKPNKECVGTPHHPFSTCWKIQVQTQPPSQYFPECFYRFQPALSWMQQVLRHKTPFDLFALCIWCSNANHYSKFQNV